MKITAKCTYDLPVFKAVQKNSRRRTGFLLFIFLLCGAACLGVGIFSTLNGIGEDGSAFDRTSIFLGALYLFLAVFIIWARATAPKRSFKKAEKSGIVTNTYTFTDDALEMVSKSDSIDSTGSVKYQALIKAVEDNDYIYIYPNNVTAYVVDKSTLEGGTMEELRAHLTSVFGKKKFRIRTK